MICAWWRETLADGMHTSQMSRRLGWDNAASAFASRWKRSSRFSSEAKS